ncbi:MAG: hypothetical protein ACI30N_04695, partial [Muribaculaceae bacterium]
IERKLQRTNHKQYPLPHYIGGEIPVPALNNEAKKMMDFVGLSAFTPDCCWEDINDSTAGYIELTGSRFGPVKIHLSNRFRRNGYATLAILAHEICHKLLEFHGLYFPQLTQVNETYTDLCTIYVGFTQLIVNGYKTTVENTTFTLGYLTKHTFEQTISLVELIQRTGCSDQYYFNGTAVYDRLEQWIKNPDKRKCHIDGFAKKQESYAALNKRITLMIRLLTEIREAYNPVLTEIDRKYFVENPSYGKDEAVVKMPIASFCLCHPELFSRSDEERVQQAERLSLRLDRSIRNYLNFSGLEDFDLQSNVHICPFCGNQFKLGNNGSNLRVIKCGKCGNRFTLDMSKYRLYEEAPAEIITEPEKKWWQFWK